MLYGLTYQQVFPQIARLANLGNVTMPSMWGINPFLLIGVLLIFVLLLFYLLERGLKRHDRLEDEG